MAQAAIPPYPNVVAAEGYFGGDSQAVARQFLTVCRHYPERAREFAMSAAYVVGERCCTHEGAPVCLPTGLEGEDLVVAAANHTGLCGKHQADVIAAVKTGAVVAKWGSTTGNKYRNQVRLDCALCAHVGGNCLLKMKRSRARAG